MRMTKGNALFAPINKDLTVFVNDWDVTIAKGTAAFVMIGPEGTAVYNLNDTGYGKLSVRAGQKHILLTPGKQIVLTRKSTDSFTEANPGCNCIGFRNVTRQQLEPGLQLFSSDFSLPSAMRNIRPLKELLNSSDPLDQKLAAHILKTASIIHITTMNRGPYRTVDLMHTIR